MLFFRFPGRTVLSVSLSSLSKKRRHFEKKCHFIHNARVRVYLSSEDWSSYVYDLKKFLLNFIIGVILNFFYIKKINKKNKTQECTSIIFSFLTISPNLFKKKQIVINTIYFIISFFKTY